MPEPEEIVRGPKSGRKHTPGKGHIRKSGPQKRKRFARRAVQKRKQERLTLLEKWLRWERLPEEVKRLRPELKPIEPRPTDE